MKTQCYTIPKLVKGKKPTVIPKGSTLDKEWAKNSWYVNYSFNGKQIRVKEGINRIDNYREKAEQAEILLQSIKNDLASGYNPINPEAYLNKITKQTITLANAVNDYMTDIEKFSARKKTVQTYRSKLRHLIDAFPNKELRDITSKNIEEYIHGKIHNTSPSKMYIEDEPVTLQRINRWTPNTVKAARRIFTTFFNWCIAESYIAENPMKKVDTKKIRSEVEAPDKNIPFTEEDARTIKTYLVEHDPFTAFFTKLIYYTCLRPGEICGVRIKDVDLAKRVISVPMSAMKNTKKNKADTIHIPNQLLGELQQLNLHHYPKDYYITSKDETIVGAERMRPDKPYKRLVKALRNLNLHGKGYNLYSFKHFSNIQRYNAGWKLTQIMKANRHSSIEMSEIYLRDIIRTTDIADLNVPEM